MTEVKACLLDSHPNVVFCISPQWPAAKSVIRASPSWTQMLVSKLPACDHPVSLKST